jgi:hypothetical protein
MMALERLALISRITSSLLVGVAPRCRMKFLAGSEKTYLMRAAGLACAYPPCL